MRKNKGFTLIELLVVISIIGVLISLSFVGFLQARVSARNGKRKADLEQIRSALELYRNDCKTYPGTVASGSSLTGPVGSPCAGVVYMQQVPSDPITPTYNYRYRFVSKNNYFLCAYLEGVAAKPTNCTNNCGGSIACNYETANP
jgi:general secretion pathway protein G